MNQVTLGRDAAAAATKRILEMFVWPYPAHQMPAVADEILFIIAAATEAALAMQQRELLKPSDN